MSTMGKRWCFTLNNYTDSCEVKLEELDVTYLVYGYERAPVTGTAHLQGFIIFKKNMRISALKKIHPTAHWEIARGSNQQAADYCKGLTPDKQPNTIVERGDMPADKGEGEKERWAVAKRACIAGNLEEIPDDIFMRYYRTCKEIKKDYMAKPDDAADVTGVWYHGPPGCGKSHSARVDYPDAYMKMQNKWWDGYQGEESVILDDFDCKELGHHIKIWADRYSFLAETKGGAINIRPKKFIITSNYLPGSLWDDAVLVAAVLRRFTFVEMHQRQAQ